MVSTSAALVITILLKAKYRFRATARMFLHSQRENSQTYIYVEGLFLSTISGPCIECGYSRFHLTSSLVLHVVIIECRKFKSTVLWWPLFA
jgi:hypothetical protein